MASKTGKEKSARPTAQAAKKADVIPTVPEETKAGDKKGSRSRKTK